MALIRQRASTDTAASQADEEPAPWWMRVLLRTSHYTAGAFAVVGGVVVGSAVCIPFFMLWNRLGIPGGAELAAVAWSVAVVVSCTYGLSLSRRAVQRLLDREDRRAHVPPGTPLLSANATGTSVAVPVMSAQHSNGEEPVVASTRTRP